MGSAIPRPIVSAISMVSATKLLGIGIGSVLAISRFFGFDSQYQTPKDSILEFFFKIFLMLWEQFSKNSLKKFKYDKNSSENNEQLESQCMEIFVVKFKNFSAIIHLMNFFFKFYTGIVIFEYRLCRFRHVSIYFFRHVSIEFLKVSESLIPNLNSRTDVRILYFFWKNLSFICS